MKARKSYYISATAIVIETRNNVLRNRKLDKNSAISKWLVLYFGLSLLPSDEVGTAFANEIMSTIPAEEWQPARLHWARWISLCALVFLLSACYEFLFCV